MAEEKVPSELLRQIAAGDREAFRIVVEQYENMFFDLAFRLTGSRQDAEDLAQESFVKIFRALPGYDPARKFSTWAYTILLNSVRNHLRRKAVIRFLSLDCRRSYGDAPAVEPADPRGGPPSSLEEREFAECFRLAVLALPLNLKDAFVLFYFHEMASRDVAGVLNVTENAVKLRLMRARQLLRKNIGLRYPACFASSEELHE